MLECFFYRAKRTIEAKTHGWNWGKSRLLLIIAVAVILGVLIGRYSAYFTTSVGRPDKKPLYWVDPMEPKIHYQGPGKSRMGMELVPVYPDGAQAKEDKGTIRISSAVVNNLGVRTTPVIKGPFSKQIETVGYIEPNENKIAHIHSYADGWIKKLIVKAVGDPVKKGQLLLQLYSPMLVNAQEEYLIALESKSSDLIEASYKRLLALHISEQQIQQLKKTRKTRQLVDIFAPQDGIIADLPIREGMRVTPETEIMSLVDLSTIWIIAQIYEDQASWVTVGQNAEARVVSFPGKIWKGNVEYVYPRLDPETRNLKVRFRFDNPNDILKPNMYASITVLAEPKQNVVSIPLEALIRSSEGDHVIVALGKGRFQIRPIVTGMESGEHVEILSGLKPGELVVTSGQFLIDSEANLKASMQRLKSPIEETHSQSQPIKKDQAIEGKGVIKALNKSQYSVTVQHEAITELSWPAMTMDFSVDKKVLLNDLQIGERVQFYLTKEKEDYVITEIKKLSP
ncbi:TPA: efflux RND transporter periplasmic adaptor subunit [Legionella pneumophila]|nr:efflux RND transporter periplasmic adaptor subunit [Legionella pneumophila]HAT1860714.1 efflux RND transporter periplasmic adaptor subunit [Legionella pneumophila]HAU2155527.1 efflux RND transporter periplasmic adaptor subunit [Legionella pneumophila]